MSRSAAAARLFLHVAFLAASSALIAGCGSEFAPAARTSALPSAMAGSVHGGQQPVSGARVYLYAISTSGNSTASTSLLNLPGFVLTGLDGGFSITGDYTCPTGSYVYLLALGGNPGLAPLTNNPDLALAAGLGPCASLSSSSYFTINEVTTVAFTYALSGYASSETQVADSAATSSLPMAFQNLFNLVDPVHGNALATTPAGAIAPQAKLNTLANALAACVNSDGTGTPCANLLAAANVTTTPADTFQAALTVAKNPGTNVTAIYNQSTANAPFQPGLTTAPSDWTIAAPPFAIPPGSTQNTAPSTYVLPPFFAGQQAQGSGVYSLTLADGQHFANYTFYTNANYINDFDLGMEYTDDAADGQSGVYLYDLTSAHTFYTNPSLYPYLYDYSLGTFLYFFSNNNTTAPIGTLKRTFYDFNTQQYLYF